MPGTSSITDTTRPWSLDGLLANQLISKREFDVAKARVVYGGRPKICPSCGAPNRPSKKQCFVCGSDLATPPGQAAAGDPADDGEIEARAEDALAETELLEAIDPHDLLYHRGNKHPGPVGPGGQMVSGGTHLLSRLYPPVFEVRVETSGPRLTLEWVPPEYDHRQVRLLGYEITREEHLPQLGGAARRWVGYTKPEERTILVTHRPNSHSYDVAPVYLNLQTGEIVWSG